MRFAEFWDKHGWQLVYTTRWPERPEELVPWEGVVRSEACRQYLAACFPRGLYRHQVEALRRYGRGEDICLTTGTASGKSAVFYAAAIEGLAQKSWGRVLALYPLKALGREQEERWKNALTAAGFSADLVGRLDGDVPTGMRNEAVRRAKVLIATPDIMHAWLLPNVGDPDIWRFVQSVLLLVVDEVHVYTGVFGSNCAFLFRRFGHLAAMANRSPAYLAASATMRDPETHLHALFGREFSVIGPDWDTSPRYPLDIAMVRPPAVKDLMTEVSKFAEYLATEGSSRFILFVDSRKQTELISAILSRSRGRGLSGGDDDVVLPRMEHLARLDVLPYRAGYEDEDRAAIQERLSSGRLRGVVSTSALELGIDVAHLGVGVLLGVPRSRTNLMQRIGRVGRRAPGTVVIINNGDVHSEAIFRNPSSLFERPLAEGALYLENPRIQYIHAMCLARHGGEHDQACGRLGLDPDGEFTSPVPWPEGFMELCLKERTGEVPPDVQSMKMEAGDEPHHVFPLRDVESQFVVEHRRGADIERMGSLSHGQVMREAYPGAVYYYATIPHRVYQVLPQARLVRVAKPTESGCRRGAWEV